MWPDHGRFLYVMRKCFVIKGNTGGEVDRKPRQS